MLNRILTTVRQLPALAVVALAAGAAVGSLNASVVVAWDAKSGDTTLSSSTASTVNANLSGTVTLTLGSGFTPSSVGNTFGGYATVDTSSGMASANSHGTYWQFTVTPASGYQVEIDSVVVPATTEDANNTHGLFIVQDNAACTINLASSLDSYGSSLGSTTYTISGSGAGYWTLTLNTPLITSSAVTLRIELSENFGYKTVGLLPDNYWDPALVKTALTVNGSVTATGGGSQPATTTTTLGSSPNPSTVGQSVTFTATVQTNSPTGTATAATGNVVFKDGGTPVFTNSSPSSGVFTYTTSGLTAGTHTFTAVYSGDSNYATSTSTATNQIVNSTVATTTTALGSAPNPSTVGQSVTFTATVQTNSPTGTATAATGNVVFKDNGTTVYTGSIANGVATYTTSGLTAGTHAFTAVYSGDSNYATSTSAATNQTVNAASGGQSGVIVGWDAKATDTTLSSATSSTLDPNLTGPTVTLALGPGFTAYNYGNTFGGYATVDTSSGMASADSHGTYWQFTVTPASGYQVEIDSVVVPATTENLANTHGLFTWQGSAACAINLASSSDSYGSSLGTVSPTGLGSDAGYWTLHLNSPLIISSAVTFRIEFSENFGYKTIGLQTDSFNDPAQQQTALSVNGSVTPTGGGSQPATTTTTLGSSPNPSTYGQPVTFAATVQTNGQTATDATGNVVFKDGGTPVSTNSAPVNGVFTYTTSGLTANTHAFTAVYSGDSKYATSTSTATNQVVNKATPTATLAVNNTPQTYTGSAQSATVAISLSSVPGSVANIQLDAGANSKTAAGTYAATADFVPTDAANYNTLTGLSAGNFVIQKATPTVTVTPYSVTYDGNPQSATVASITGAGSETGVTVGSVTLNTTHAAAGSYPSDSWTFTGTANYNNIGSTTISNNIGKASSSVTVNGTTSFTYTGSAQGPAFNKSGSSASLTYAYSGTANDSTSYSGTTAPTAAGTYSVIASVAADANFNGASSSATAFTIVNPPPTVTGTKTVTRHPNQVLHISKANDILSQVTVGTLGDTLSLTSWSVSTKGVTLTSNPDYLNYAASSPNEADSFSYTVTDNHGNSVTGTINITMKDTSLTGTPIAGVLSTHNGTSAYTVKYVGVIGAWYRVQRATDAQFTQNVTTIHDDQMISPPVSVTDNSPPGGTAFYRVVLLP